MIDIIFAEFGGKFTPDIDNISAYFPESNIKVYTEKDCENMFDKRSPYWGFHMNDLWKVAMLLRSKADVAIALDADVKIVDKRVSVLPLLAKKFGVCLPANPRQLVKVDTEIGSHSDKQLDETLGMAHAFNMTPIALDTSNDKARQMLEEYCKIIVANPVRGPLAMWRAVWKTGFYPCLLPVQWCVCAEDVGCGNEVILHYGHSDVRKHYGI